MSAETKRGNVVHEGTRGVRRTSQRADLRPCPFGCESGRHILGEPTPMVWKKPLYLDGERIGTSARVICLNCGAEGPGRSSVTAAVLAWNTRVDAMIREEEAKP